MNYDPHAARRRFLGCNFSFSLEILLLLWLLIVTKSGASGGGVSGRTLLALAPVLRVTCDAFLHDDKARLLSTFVVAVVVVVVRPH